MTGGKRRKFVGALLGALIVNMATSAVAFDNCSTTSLFVETTAFDSIGANQHGFVSNPINSSPSASGLGPLLANIHREQGWYRSSFSLLNEDTQLINLSLGGRLRLVGADRTEALAPGLFDGGLGLESTGTLDSISFHADAYYQLLGPNLAAQRPNNRVSFDLGAGYWILPNLNTGLSYEQKAPAGPSGSAPQDLAATTVFALARPIWLFTSGSTLVSPGAPWYGLSAGASFQF